MKRRYQLPGSPYRRIRINGELRGRDMTQFCRSFTMARILLVIIAVVDNSHNSASTLHVHEAKSIYGTATLCLRSSRQVACSLHPCFCCDTTADYVNGIFSYIAWCLLLFVFSK